MWVFTVDVGRAGTKVATGFGPREMVFFPTGLAAITNAQYDRAILRSGNPSPDYMVINDQAYAIGPVAWTYNPILPQATAQRYRREYIGVLAVAAITRLVMGDAPWDWRPRGGECHIVASHPPQDQPHVDRLILSLQGDWHIESATRAYDLHVEAVFAEDEPVAAVMNTVLTQNGDGYQRGRPRGVVDVIDMGGKTMDHARLDANSAVLDAFTSSHAVGINDILGDLEATLIKTYPDRFVDTVHLDRDRLETALMTGYFTGGGSQMNVIDEAAQLRERYLTEVRQFVAGFDLANTDSLVLAGGATAMFLDELTRLIPHENIVTAEETGIIQFAQVRGMLKQYNMWKTRGWL